MAYNYYRTITVDKTKVSASDKTDFTIGVIGTYAYLATIANGGNVTDASGNDIVFFSDINLTTKLSYECERYIATTGEVIFWIKIPTLSTSVDTVIYMAYGNGSITTFQGGARGDAWNSSYKVVLHLSDDINAIGYDSTVNANDFTNTNVTGIASKIGEGGNFYAANARLSRAGLAIPSSGHITFWWKTTSEPETQFIIGLMVRKASPLRTFDNNGQPFAGNSYWYGGFYNTTGGDDRSQNNAGTGLAANTWYKYDCIWTNGGATRMYRNGVAVGSFTATLDATWDTTSETTYVNYDSVSPVYGTAHYDEIRLSNVAHDVAWILTEYNNQNSPSTFYTVGAAVAVNQSKFFFKS